MMIDASALVAILVGEPEREAFLDALGAREPRMTSSIALFETALALRRVFGIELDRAEALVRRLVGDAGIAVEPVTDADGRGAIAAFARYGRGTSHPARLNMGDCFAYAMAQNRRHPLLFKGDDFIHTDVESAIASH